MNEVIWGDDGLVNDISFILIFNIIIGPLLNIVNMEWLYKIWKRKRIIKQGSKCMMTQKEANTVFEGDDFDMSERYALYIKTVLISIFFLPIMPISSILGIFATLLTFWIDKYLLYFRHTVPFATGSDLNFAMYHFFDFILFIYGVR